MVPMSAAIKAATALALIGTFLTLSGQYTLPEPALSTAVVENVTILIAALFLPRPGLPDNMHLSARSNPQMKDIMSLTKHSLLKFGITMVLISCTSSRNASKGLVACKTAKDCPAGYTCEQVPNSDAIYSVCCKDKGCAIDTTPGMGVDGSSVTSQDGQSSAFEAGYLVDGQPLEASTNPDLPDTDLKTLDAMGTCGNDDDDCPTTAPMCLNHFCAACTTSIDCAGNPSGDLCNTT